MAGHRKGRSHCGAKLPVKACLRCKSFNGPTSTECPKCGGILRPWCERRVPPGTRCDSHTDVTDVHPDAPATYEDAVRADLGDDERDALDHVTGRPLSQIARTLAEASAARALVSRDPDEIVKASQNAERAMRIRDME